MERGRRGKMYVLNLSFPLSSLLSSLYLFAWVSPSVTPGEKFFDPNSAIDWVLGGRGLTISPVGR